MRMRKKKHLDERLALCKNLTVMEIDDRNEQTAIEVKEYIDFRELFGNDNPVYMEIGCGKGGFCREAALREPNINFLAVEKAANVMVTACEQCADVKNLHFLLGGAEYLPKFIKPESISRLYLNFSCPFPKKKYAAHRLTAGRFLKIYKSFLKRDAEIHQKTDNMHFFEFSLEQFSQNGFSLKNVSLDLHASDFEGNIMTEYERLFSSKGQPIYRLEAYIKE
ncbi:MAG: tRNA (guanosine(46)-N7)-methyltransferase TrmB [Clostridia bacterium]|nr:tRNA (guanosine(46)-N7)-methyltransferase TrmB [Clostridia bacterium]